MKSPRKGYTKEKRLRNNAIKKIHIITIIIFTKKNFWSDAAWKE